MSPAPGMASSSNLIELSSLTHAALRTSPDQQACGLKGARRAPGSAGSSSACTCSRSSPRSSPSAATLLRSWPSRKGEGDDHAPHPFGARPSLRSSALHCVALRFAPSRSARRVRPAGVPLRAVPSLRCRSPGDELRTYGGSNTGAAACLPNPFCRRARNLGTPVSKEKCNDP